jgi:hypothetical protein
MTATLTSMAIIADSRLMAVAIAAHAVSPAAAPVDLTAVREVSQADLRVAAMAALLVESAAVAKPEASPPGAGPASAAAECTAGVECMAVVVATAAVAADANHSLS